jgi:hypothetical protein
MTLTRIVGLVGATALLAGTALAGLPLSALTNGGFEQGFAGWIHFATTAVVPGGCDGSASALRVTDVAVGQSYVGQPIGPYPTSAQAFVLDFCARVAPVADLGGCNSVQVVHHWQLPDQLVVAGVFFCNDFVGFGTWMRTLFIPQKPAPTDGAWHRYTAIANGASGSGALLLDGVPFLVHDSPTYSGEPGFLTEAPEWLLAGDTTGATAPTVHYDEFWVGPVI